MKRSLGTAGLVVFLLSLAAGLSVLAGRHLPLMVSAERWLADYRIATLLPAEPPHPDIVIAALTEETLEQFPYRSPIDRGFLADLLRQIEQKGARAILLDVLLDQPTEPDKDARLAAVIRDLSIPLVVSYATPREGLTERQAAYLMQTLPPDDRGLSNLPKDPFDGTVRWIFPGRTLEDGTWGPGAVPLLAHKLGLSPPTTERPIAWRGKAADAPYAFSTLPAHIAGLVPEAWIAGKIVLIGADLSLTDRHRTPFSVAGEGASMPGVVIFAHALGTLLDNRPSQDWSQAQTLVLIVLAVAIGGGLALIPLSLTMRLTLAIGIAAGFWIGAFALFHYAGTLVPLVVPTFAFGLATWATEAAVIRNERKQKHYVKSAFSQFVAPEVVQQIVADPDKLTLQGERRILTFLFSDVAGFTKFTENTDPEAVTQLLNRYLDTACAVIHRHQGTVCNFMGDGVFALWGAPTNQPDHAERAVACALELGQALEAFRKALDPAFSGFGATRIGVHAGPAVVGIVGSTLRLQYTAIGDAVNTASRLESLNKHFGTYICVSADALPDSFRNQSRAVGRIIVRGRNQPTEVYEVLTPEEAASDRIQRYKVAYALLDAGKTDEARAAFAALAEDWPDDGCVAVHMDRLAADASDTVIRMLVK